MIPLTGCTHIVNQDIIVHQGHADIGELKEGRITTLDGEWEFYPAVFLNPDGSDLPNTPSYSSIPDPWTGNPPHRGYGSYRLRISGLTPGFHYAFYIYEKVSAASYYIDGRLLESDGFPGTSQESEIPDLVPSVVSFRADSSKAELIIHISNFSMKNGGIWESVRFGRTETMQNYRILHILSLALVIGALSFMALYHLFLFLLQREKRTHLWLSLTIILVIIKSLITGEHILMRLLADENQLLLIRISTVAVAFMIPFYQKYLHHSFPGIGCRFSLYANFILAFFFSSVILFGDLIPAQKIFSFYMWIIFINLFYFLYLTLLTVIQKKTGSIWLLTATILAIACGLNDILYDLHIINTAYVLNVGLFIFMILHSFLNAERSSRAYKELDILRSELENKVDQRTRELEHEKNKLSVLARIDSLTGLYNRNSSREIFEREIHRFKRSKLPFSVVMIDLDFFKKINDSYGHTSGDYALQIMGISIREISRRTDFCFRWGGEEFLLLMPETSEENAFVHAENLRMKIGKTPIETGGNRFFLSMSFGISSIKDPKETPEMIVERADTALYQAKEDGRNRGIIWKKSSPA
ncbi:MAG: GGDEF domain-containing protein [Spirochaetales bacterium]|nr:GGDEF domain-containing protein [Spirochaetales bacterium]